MSFTITEAFVKAYSSNLYMLAQQKQSKLRPLCRVETFTGEQMFVERIGAADAYLVTERHGDTKLVNTPHSSRRLDPKPMAWADLIDEADKVRMLIDPTNPYSQTAVSALNRAMDDIITQAIFGTVYDKAGNAVLPYNECKLIKSDDSVVSGNAFTTSSTNNPMSLTKILTAKRLLDEADIDPDRRRFIICSPSAIAQMLNTDKLTSADYNTVRALARGEIDTFCGFTFIMTNRLNTLGGSTYGGAYSCDGATSTSEVHWAAVCEGAIVLGLGQDITASIDKRPDKNYSTQVYAKMDCGACRVEGPAVVLGLHKASSIS